MKKKPSAPSGPSSLRLNLEDDEPHPSSYPEKIWVENGWVIELQTRNSSHDSQETIFPNSRSLFLGLSVLSIKNRDRGCGTARITWSRLSYHMDLVLFYVALENLAITLLFWG